MSELTRLLGRFVCYNDHVDWGWLV